MNKIFTFRFVGSLGSIIVKCKDLRVIQLDIPGMEECLNIASSIEVKKKKVPSFLMSTHLRA